MKKTFFVLDTSALVYDSKCYENFQYNIIPIVVLEELDKLKKQSNEVGKNARAAIRNLDEISNQGKIHNGVKIGDIVVKIDISPYEKIGEDEEYGDNKILSTAKKYNTNNDVVLVSRDINLRVRAKAMGIAAQDYDKEKKDISELYLGYRTIQNQEAGLNLFSEGYIPIEQYNFPDLYPNECILFSGENGKGIAAGKVVGDTIVLIKDRFPWNLKLRNKEQLFAADLIMDKRIDLVSLVGLAGSGKSLIALACALELVLEQRLYDSLLIYRPNETVGKGIGFLPGSATEKLDPLFAPIDDAFAFLFGDKSNKKEGGWKAKLHQYIDNGTICKEAVCYIRGRSINNAVMLIDEFQNFSPDDAKTILTRAGNNTKIILTGDLSQIDAHGLDTINNGLTYIVEKFKTSELSGHITFTKGERSPLATLAAEIL
jgi:PhoH-like ATPase